MYIYIYIYKQKKTPSFITVMSRTFTLIGRESVLSAEYFPPVELSSEDQYGLGLIGFYTYNSILNVDEQNNRFVYIHSVTGEVCTIEIPPGNYEVDTFGKYIQQQMIGHQTNESEEQRTDDDVIFCLKANNTTLRCEMNCIHDIDFTTPNSSAHMLGFTPRLYTRNQKHQSDLSVEILKHRLVRVKCNITSGAYLNDNEDHTLFEFDIDVEPGYKLTVEPKNIIYMPVTRRDTIDNITLTVLDEKDNLIDFRGEELIVRLELKKL